MLAALANPHRIKASHRRRRRAASRVWLPGQYYDAESGFVSNGFRDCYEPATGRYCEPDPMGQSAGPSLYAYVGNNPLNYMDPYGLAGEGNHYYNMWVPLCMGCTRADGLNAMRNFSAPGAPYAQDGTHDLILTGRNPIRQTVDPCHFTITNQTLPGHFFGGQVVITITDDDGNVGAQIEGSGYGPHAFDNQAFGPVIFGGLGLSAYYYLNPQMQF